MNAHDIEVFDQILRFAAQKEILPRFEKLNDVGVKEKTSALDLVTEADIAAENTIHLLLQKEYPQATIIGEESAEGRLGVGLIDRGRK